MRSMCFAKNALVIFGLLAVSNLASPAHACGPDSDCVIGDRTYRIRMPEGHDGKTPVGAVFYMHGYKGSARNVMRNKGMGKAVSDMGLALIAPKSAFDDWAIPNSPSRKTPVELEYFDALIEDVTTRFPIDRKRILATGFSAGGMMVWNLICHRSEMFTAFAPISGTFWAPTPQTCDTSPAHVFHIHGKTDRVVPLKGRAIASTRQGNVFEVLEMYRTYGSYQPSEKYTRGDLECEGWKNADGKMMEFCLHPRGHDMRSKYFINVWKKLEGLGKLAAAPKSDG